MPKIAHTADIHIRALSRHSEYRQAFKEFIKDCKEQEVDHIFVGGDIFHTKTTGISPEYIDLLTWWLNEMSKVADVHLILGNHDGNLVNMSRQDAVSPIVEAMANPRVHLYKKSGVYEFSPGYTFCVFSLFDEEGWKNVSPIPNKVNIACYHGPVWGSVTETDWAVEDGLKVDFFDPYPFVMLGDIHKRQVLKKRAGRPTILYPGTLIQQNYAEDLVHGYTLWNIHSEDSWEVQFRQIKNYQPFVTIEWAGTPSSTAAQLTKYPAGMRVRVKSDVQLHQNEVHKLSELIKTSCGASEVTYKSDESLSVKEAIAGTTKVSRTDLRSTDSLLKLLKEHHSNVALTQAEQDAVTETIRAGLSSASTGEETSRGAKWSLQRMSWDNTFTYGEDNVIDFGTLSGIVGIFGPNRTGKSSIVGTLMYTLFNTTDRGPMKNMYVCNVRRPHCSGNVLLTHNGSIYSVERATIKSTNKKGVVSATTALNLFKMNDDGSFEDMCGEQRNDTEKTVRGLIGTAEDFLLTSVSAQGENNNFISQGSTKRRTMLSKFLDLDILDKLHEFASKELNSYKSQLKNFPEKDWTALESQLASIVDSTQMSEDESASAIAAARGTLSLLQTELARHSASPVTHLDVETQRSLAVKKRLTADASNTSLNQLTSDVDELRTKLVTVEDLLRKIDIDVLKKKSVAAASLQATLLSAKHLFDSETTALGQQKKSLKILDEVPCGDEYPTCKFIKDAHHNRSLLVAQQQKVDIAKEAFTAVASQLKLVADPSIEERIQKHAKATDLASRLRLEISNKETSIERAITTAAKDLTAAEDAERHLANLEYALKNDENAEVVSIRSKIEEISGDIKRHEKLVLKAVSDRATAAAQLQALRSEKTTRDGILSRMKNQELVTTAFSKRGVPLSVMSSQLPLINAEIAKILHGIVDFTIELESDEDTDALEIYINYGDSRRIIELCSGMEKTIASLTLRVALTNISSLPRSDVLIVDEGFGTLDAAGIEACNRLLVSLKRYFKIVIVITHVDGIKDIADHVIEITKNEKDTNVRYAS